MENLDIAQNRKDKKYAKKDILRRIFWGITSILFRYSLRNMFGWRNWLLRLYGARIGRNVHIYRTATIYFPWNLKVGDYAAIGENVLIYNLGQIEIGDKSTISHQAHLCAGTHDYQKSSLPLIKSQIIIKDQTWICADAFVSPGITINTGAIVGARAVVTKNVEAWHIVAGNPAKKIGTRTLKSE